MRIKRVHLSNYKRFTDLTIKDIPDSTRLVVLIGPNGSGKSSLFDAFLVKSWGARHNYSLSGNQYEGYYHKDPYQGPESTGMLAESIGVEWHSVSNLSSDQWATAFNIRSAYRTEADFRTETLEVVKPSYDVRRFDRIIDIDQSVSDNFNRLAWKRQADIDGDADGSMTIDQYRKEFLSDLQEVMQDLFLDPTLSLQDFGGIRDAGAFRFSKGMSRDFHYKNLSGGEKAGFDLLLDIFVKRNEYQDAIYCIDEPEAHVATALHGQLLKAMLKLMPGESQLWIATHSIGFVKQAFELMQQESNVVFLDFSEHDFDQTVVMKPRVPNRSFWKSTYQVALNDLSDLIAPQNIVICEGDKDGADKGFDADCYNRLFSEIHPDTLFISYGSSGEVAKSGILMNILGAVAKGVKVWRLIDRDDMADSERSNKIQDGLCVLKRRELENYLYDPDVLRTFLKNNEKEDSLDNILMKRQELLNCSPKPDDDLKAITQELLRHIRHQTRLPNLGNSRKEFALEHLIPALIETPNVFDELTEVIF